MKKRKRKNERKTEREGGWKEGKKENSSGDLLHNDVNVPKATELYT